MSDPRPAVAAKWWADFLRRPPSLNKFNNGDLTAGLLAVMTKNLSSPEKADAFETALRTRLEKDLARSGVLTLRVDYHPQGVLADVALECKCYDLLDGLPWKTTMWVGESDISVAVGYRGEVKKIWGPT